MSKTATKKIDVDAELTVIPEADAIAEGAAPMATAPVEPTAVPGPEAPADALRRLAVEVEPFAARLAAVEAELDAPAPVTTATLLDDQIAARRKHLARRAELEVERDVIRDRLVPLRGEIDKFEKQLAEERKAELHAAALADADCALESVSKARAALDAAADELVEASARARQSGLRFGFVPEISAKFGAELPAIVGIVRKIDIALNH